MVKVKALQRVYYGGKEYAKDDELEVSERDAVAFGLLRKVMRPEQETKAEATPEASTEPAAAETRKYRRRDQRAED